ncbi:MAG: metallophosphoesterase [Thermoplasmatota archaeon]
MKIAHISDIHTSLGSDFNKTAFDKAVKILNRIDKDIIFISGDITTEGLLAEYEIAQEKLDLIDGEKIVIPGNHDERNLGYQLFPEFFGPSTNLYKYKEFQILGLASSEPDKNEGRLGRRRHLLIQDALQNHKKMTILGFHHHLIPVPNSGRETNILEDAGETLDIILKNNVPLVLMGHRHVPYAVKIHNTLLVNAGTFSSNRTRAHFGHTFNIIEVNDSIIEVSAVSVEKDKQENMIHYDVEKGIYTNRYIDV